MTDKQQNFIEIYKANLGNVSESCKKAGIKSRQTFYGWLAEHKDFAEAIKEVEEQLLDFVESQQMLLIRGVPKYKTKDGVREFTGWETRPDRDLIKFYLLTKGKSRGYVDKRQIELTTPEHQRLQQLSDDELQNEIKLLLEKRKDAD